LNTLNTLRGLLAGTEEDPDADIDLNMAVRNSASDLRLSNQRLTDLLNEIQALKSTLSQSELNNLKNKFLYFDDNKLVMEKSNDKCRNVIQETQIPKRKIF